MLLFYDLQCLSKWKLNGAFYFNFNLTFQARICTNLKYNLQNMKHTETYMTMVDAMVTGDLSMFTLANIIPDLMVT